MKKVFVLIILVLFITGCAQIDKGSIVNKYYDDPDTWVTLVKSGKSMVPITHHDSEHWVIKIEGINEKNNKIVHRKVFVNEDEYNELNVGDYYVIEE